MTGIGSTPLFMAALGGHEGIVGQLLTSAQDVSADVRPGCQQPPNYALVASECSSEKRSGSDACRGPRYVA